MPVTVTLSQIGATNYTVRDIDNNIVVSGTVPSTSFALADPAGGWKCGWYRVYFTGPSTDPVFGTSYGTCCFLIVPSDSNFPTLPATTWDTWGYTPSGAGNVDTNPNNPLWGINFDSPIETITRACLGLGPGRLSAAGQHVSSGTPYRVDEFQPDAGWGDTTTGNSHMITDLIKPWWINSSEGGVAETVRSRRQFVSFPNWGNTWDAVFLTNSAGTGSWAHVMVKDLTVDGDKVFITTSAGSTSGRKIVVEYPTAGTVVETFDNIDPVSQTAVETATSTSSYIRAFRAEIQDPTDFADFTSIKIGRVNRDAVASVSSALYPLGVTHFEGPYNEPGSSSYTAHITNLFAAAIHQGNASAKAMGPIFVNIADTASWQLFFDNGGADNLDALGFHAYNTVIANNLPLARTILDNFTALLASKSLQDMELWHTEANNVLVPSAVLRPREARQVILWTLLFEQYGIPSERNIYWYDWSHGFWSYPSFMFCGTNDGSPMPQVGLLATLGRETFGKNFNHAIDFGSVLANNIFFGNVYGDAASGTVAVMACASYMPGSQVTLTVSGTTNDLTTVDAWGNGSTVSQSSGRVTLDVSDLPTYIRLPAGVNVSVYSVGFSGDDWGSSPNPSVSSTKLSAKIGGSANGGIADDGYMTLWNGSTSSTGVAYSPVTTRPDTAEIKFNYTVNVERVVVTVLAIGDAPALLDFDVQTWDGSAWTTQATVTRTVDPTFTFGSDSTDTGSTVESYEPLQWIDNVKMPTPVDCQGVRIYVRETSFGDAPDDLARTTWGKGTDYSLAIQEIAIVSSTTYTLPNAYKTEVLADSPTIYYRLDETSGTAATSQVNSPTADGTYGGTYTLNEPGAINDGNAAAYLDGITVRIPDAAISATDTFSIETWIKPTASASGDSDILSSESFGPKLSYGGTTTGRYLKLKQGETVLCTSTTALAFNTWSHVVLTKSGSTVHMYINGEDVTGTLTNVTFTTGSGWAVGTAGDGIFDEFAYYTTVLSQSRVQTHYLAGIAPAAPTAAAAPVVTGTASVGSQVISSWGKWSGSIPTKFTYQWQSSAHGANTWSDIIGATRSDYILTSGESTKDVRCVVTASSPGGSTSQNSNVIGAVA